MIQAVAERGSDSLAEGPRPLSSWAEGRRQPDGNAPAFGSTPPLRLARPLPCRLRRPRGPETGSWPSSAHGRRGYAARSRADKRRDCSRRWPIVMLPAWRRPPAPCRPDRPRAISAVGERSAASVLPHDIRPRTGVPHIWRPQARTRLRFVARRRSEEQTFELQSIMRISYDVVGMKKKLNY